MSRSRRSGGSSVRDDSFVTTLSWKEAATLLESLRAIQLGVTRRDKVAILRDRLRLVSWPLGSMLVRNKHETRSWLGRSLGSRTYQCQTDGIIYNCMGIRSAEQLLPSYEPAVRAEVSRLREGDFLDIGAGIGVFSLRAARQLATRGQVVSMEPHPQLCRALRSAASDNKLSNITVLQAAAWSEPGTVLLNEHVFGGSFIDHSIVFRTGGNAIPVSAMTVDSVIEEKNMNRMALIKIDAEGAETKILAGMSMTLRRFPRLRIVLEALTKEAVESCTRTLSANGFRIEKLSPPNYLALGPDVQRK